MLRDSNLPPPFWAKAMMTFMYLRNRTSTGANEGIKPYEYFYGMKPDVGQYPPSETLRKLEDRGI